MAWMENQKSARIGEVTWQAAGEIDGRCEWKIGWKSPKGEEIASATVKYEAAQLSAGAGYYRDVWSQLARGLHFEEGKGSTTGKELETAFWRGSARAGMTRTGALAHAQAWLNQGSPHSKAVDAAELAGLLSQGALPILGGSYTLDYLMLARAAAWLCHAETMTGTAMTREWCVVSHLAGREIPASLAWKEAKDATVQDAPGWRWWDMILTNYPAPVKDVCLFAAKPGQAESGLPFVLSYLRFQTGASNALENILAELYGQKLLSQPDHAPLLIDWFAMGRLRQMSLVMALHNQKDWLEALTLQKQPGADERSSMAADAAEEALAAMKGDEAKNVPLPGLAATGKVVEMGAKSHDGPLTPQAAVSSGEILLHGWESSLLVWHELFYFVERRWGVHELSASLAKGVGDAAPSLALMMKPLDQRHASTGFPLAWLEYLEDQRICHLAIDQKDRSTAKQGDPGIAWQFLRNCMKRGPTAYDQWRTLFPSNTGEVNSIRLAEMMLKQSSENSMAQACRFYHIGIPEFARERFKSQGVTIFEKTRKACPNAFLLQRDLLAAELKKSAAPALEAAQKLEAHYWLAPGRDHIDFIMEKYVEANAPRAAARFYSRALEVDGGSIGFSNTEAPMRWMLAWLQGKKDEMRAAATDAPSYSARDLEKICLNEMCLGDTARARQTAKAYVERYGSAPQATTWLASMLPLLDALKDQGHANHAEAQKQLLAGKNYPHIQFMILKQLEFSKEESAKLMMQEAPLDYMQILIAYWHDDAAEFQKMKNALTDARRSRMPAMLKVMVAYLQAQLLKLPEVEPPDLKPAGESRLDELVRQAMRKSGLR